MFDLVNSINLIEAVVTNTNNALLILITARIFRYPKIEYWFGILFMPSIVPLLFILIKAFDPKRELLYLVQLVLMISFIIVEFVLDHWLKIEFRQNRNNVIPYLMLFYASYGGMIRITCNAGNCGL